MVTGPNGIVDLHTHTTFSDGSLNPAELIERAAENDVSILSITDHDTLAAYKDPGTQEAAVRHGITLVPGIEISSSYNGRSLHVLGLFVDVQSTALGGLLGRQKAYREDYAEKVTDLLRQDGWHPSDEILNAATTVTKAHIAEGVVTNPSNETRLRREFGDIPTRGRFIEARMNRGGAYYVERQSVSPGQTIDAIHEAGGLAVCAHPIANLQEGMKAVDLEEALSRLGFDALEAVYYYHDQSNDGVLVDEVAQMIQLAEAHGLAVSSGSDYHGPNPHHGSQVEVGFKGFSQKPGLAVYEKLLALKALQRPQA